MNIPVLSSPADLEELRGSINNLRKADEKIIRICTGTGCNARGAAELVELFQKAAKESQENISVTEKSVGCHGLCELGPIVVIDPGNIFYNRVKVTDVEEIFRETVLSGNLIERLLYLDHETGEQKETEEDIPFYKFQKRLVLKGNGILDPASLEDYIHSGGFSAMEKALCKMEPEDIIAQVLQSGLRGRGGAGFPTGRKWAACREAEGDEKYVVCNGDEGDPGAFMDRSLMEGNPYSILEGMIIGARAVGASWGYIYVRHEYPLAVSRLNNAIVAIREAGLLGDNILGTGFNFNLKVRTGAGAFVCGEETALLRSLEGKRGMPSPRPPFPAHKGLNGQPTNINNVETYASIPVIIGMGAEWYSSFGTETSKGTKIFALTGKVRNTGLVEVPMGVTLNDIVFKIGAGIPGDKKFKAVQMGGPSGGCVPEEHMGLPIDFESLKQAGAIMGSGGMVVMDETSCMVDMARYFLEFTQNESCGKCVPCRVGTRHMKDILTRICEGKGEAVDIQKLEELSVTIKTSSLCALGQTAPNPVLTTLKYFREEYEEHIHDKKCRAKKCKELLSFRIIEENCIGCGVCKKHCPVTAITGQKKEIHFIDQNTCINCGKCFDVCKFSAVEIS